MAKSVFGPKTIDEAEFGIQIHRRERQPQRQVRAQKIRLVVVIKGVAGKRRVALHRLVVAELDQVALDGINLRRCGQRHEHRQPQRARPNLFIARSVSANVSSKPTSGQRSVQAIDSLPAGHARIFGLLSVFNLCRCRHSTLKYSPKQSRSDFPTGRSPI